MGFELLEIVDPTHLRTLFFRRFKITLLKLNLLYFSDSDSDKQHTGVHYNFTQFCNLVKNIQESEKSFRINTRYNLSSLMHSISTILNTFLLFPFIKVLNMIGNFVSFDTFDVVWASFFSVYALPLFF